MPKMSFVWTLDGHGWAACTVADDQGWVEVTASYITLAPDDLLEAVTKVVLLPGEARVRFEAEPTEFRWLFRRERDQVWVQILQFPDSGLHDKAGTEIWSSWQTVESVARAVIRGFDDVAMKYGESQYQDTWGHPFPRTGLESYGMHCGGARPTGRMRVERIEVELFSDGGNNAIVRMPRREFPGVVVQGDTLANWRHQLANIATGLRRSPSDPELLGELECPVSELDEVLGRYEEALAMHGLKRPY